MTEKVRPLTHLMMTVKIKLVFQIQEGVNAIWGLLQEACEEWYPGVLGELGG